MAAEMKDLTRRTSRATKLEALKNNIDLNPNAPTIGQIVAWTIGGKTEINRDTLMRAWLGAGFDAKYIKEIRDKTAVIRSLHALELKGFIDKIRDDKEKAIWNVVGRKVNEALTDADYQKENQIVFDKKTKEVDPGREDFRAIFEQLLERFGEAYVQEDLSKFLVEAVNDEGGVTFKPRTGVYFIPNNTGLTPKILAFVDELQRLGFDCYTTYADIPYNGSSMSQMMDNFKREMGKQLSQLVKELEELENSPIDRAGKNATAAVSRRTKALQDKLEEIRKAHGKIKLFEDQLRLNADDLHANAEKVAEQVNEMLTKI